MELPLLENFDFKGKRILVRCDLDVPLENGKITDEIRLRESLPTIKYLLEHDASVILMGHLGRPGGRIVENLSLRPVAQKFAELLSLLGTIHDKQIGVFEGFEVGEGITLLENLRFDEREEDNNEDFARQLANLGDFYVNEAFAASHREHSSIVGVPKLLPHCAGFHFASEVENLSKVLENPKTPLVFVIGGAKPETKLPLVSEFAQKATWVLVGGALAQNAKCKMQNNSTPRFAAKLDPPAGGQIQNLNFKTILFADLTNNGLDISKNSVEEFIKIIKSAGTVVWNGPMGKYEKEKSAQGTKEIAEAVAESEGFSVVGGGDTIAALKKFQLLDKIDYVSTGGGAMLEFLAKGTLPGIKALF